MAAGPLLRRRGSAYEFFPTQRGIAAVFADAIVIGGHPLPDPQVPFESGSLPLERK